jgi:hypothetical protein
MVCLYSRNIVEGCAQAVSHLMDIVPLLLGDRGTHIIGCHLCLIKQPLKDKQGGCRKRKSVYALIVLFRHLKLQVHINLPLVSLRVSFRAFSVIFAIISQHMHNTFTTLLFIYIRLHVSVLHGPSSGRYNLPSLQTKMRKYLQY